MSITSEQRSREQNSCSNATTNDHVNDDSSDFAFDQTILDDTNKILKELERKLSISSSTSSQQTNTSSVVYNNQYSGLGKQRIQSHVLNTMIHQDNYNSEYSDHEKSQRIHNSIFNPNELFQERSQYTKFTKLASHYNDDSIAKITHLSKRRERKGSNSVVRQNSLNLTKNRLEKGSQLYSSNYDNDRQQIDDFLGDAQVNDIYASDEEADKEEGIDDDGDDDDEDEDEESRLDFYYTASHDGDDDDDNDDFLDTFDDGDGSAYSDDETEGNKRRGHHEYEEYDGELDQDQDDLIIPPSPPRSPPRDLDPNKLYGLYDFSGPDPSHCSLTRDEPVHLLNDEDNYWWLIKKLTKEEKIARYQQTNDASVDIDSDREDGKIGFVPAECLETHGERLARLNCHKNEEMERLVENELQLIDRQPKTKKTIKTVAFENLGNLMDSDDEEKDGEEQCDNQQRNGHGHTSITSCTFTTSNDEHDIRKILELYNVDLNELQPPSQLQIQEPETLSDVYPMEAPLIINKRSNGASR
ncbi:SH3 domain family protein [Candida parapsilosis]|uniref:SH3 domain-containing protein n=2 Tax=Candida parapsilosis TaxID=5480 RepID=G8BCL0_CANPC|nr:uncharacterized protein CPAR2_206480 [Candida parapsilosis]KAF6054845.1 SH3 domain family protein [Candida parapsilosis]KAF6056130.1 SH3 domain family protein [Candida parapsilosis]KAF6059062.1 SH3 domain family protein [Candida parapsilosis]KAF6067819.1 SH3 domain family protein [Candida parapsilosis]CCE43005.1 hypothetical protein CPAR2_206480 [Candida parapsilosis]